MKKGMVFLTIVFLAVTLTMPALGAGPTMPATQQAPAIAITETITITCPATVPVKEGGRTPIPPIDWKAGDQVYPHDATYSFRDAKISQSWLMCMYEFAGGQLVVSIYQVAKPGYSCQVMTYKNGFRCMLNR